MFFEASQLISKIEETKDKETIAQYLYYKYNIE